MITPMIGDKLYMRTGFEQDQLEACLYAKKLNEDPEFKEMEEAMKKAVDDLKKEMKERGKSWE